MYCRHTPVVHFSSAAAMPSLNVWLTAAKGRLPPVEQAKLWRLRETLRKTGQDYSQYQWMAGQVEPPPPIPPVDSSTSPLQSPGAAERWGGCAEKSSAQAVVLYRGDPSEPILRGCGNLCASSAGLGRRAHSYVQCDLGHEAPNSRRIRSAHLFWGSWVI